MSKLELSILVGAESKAWLNSLEAVATRLEKLNALSADTDKADQGEDEQPEEKTVVSVKKGKATSKPVVEEENFDLGASEDEDTEETQPTIKEVIAACKANRTEAIKVLKKMKVNSVHELKPASYSKVLAELGA